MKNLLALALSLAAFAALGTSTVHAQSPELLIQEGLEMRRQHRDADALERFEAAYRIGQSGQALAQIALAEQALGRFAAAEVHMQSAVSMQDPWIASRRPQLQQALTQIQAQLGTVQVANGPPGAVVYVNGEARGTLPDAANLRVRAGSVVIEVRAEGYVTVQRSVQVQAGGVWRENLAMVQVQAGQPMPQPGPTAQPGPVAQPINNGYQPTYQPTRQVETSPRWGLFIAGTAIFAGLWLTTGVIDVSLEGEGLGFIPIAGPFILLEEFDDGDFVFTILVIDGIAQIAGLTMAVLGLILQNEEVVMALGDDADAPVLTVVPGVSPIAGLGDTGLAGRALPAGSGATVGATLQLAHF